MLKGYDPLISVCHKQGGIGILKILRTSFPPCPLVVGDEVSDDRCWTGEREAEMEYGNSPFPPECVLGSRQGLQLVGREPSPLAFEYNMTLRCTN